MIKFAFICDVPIPENCSAWQFDQDEESIFCVVNGERLEFNFGQSIAFPDMDGKNRVPDGTVKVGQDEFLVSRQPSDLNLLFVYVVKKDLHRIDYNNLGQQEVLNAEIAKVGDVCVMTAVLLFEDCWNDGSLVVGDHTITYLGMSRVKYSFEFLLGDFMQSE